VTAPLPADRTNGPSYRSKLLGHRGVYSLKSSSSTAVDGFNKSGNTTSSLFLASNVKLCSTMLMESSKTAVLSQVLCVLKWSCMNVLIFMLLLDFSCPNLFQASIHIGLENCMFLHHTLTRLLKLCLVTAGIITADFVVLQNVYVVTNQRMLCPWVRCMLTGVSIISVHPTTGLDDSRVNVDERRHHVDIQLTSRQCHFTVVSLLSFSFIVSLDKVWCKVLCLCIWQADGSHLDELYMFWTIC